MARKKLIYAVRFTKANIIKYPEHSEIMKEFNVYLLKIIEHYDEFFKDRGVHVEINNPGTCVYIIGARPKYLMECKITLKNVVESMVCLVIKNI